MKVLEWQLSHTKFSVTKYHPGFITVTNGTHGSYFTRLSNVNVVVVVLAWPKSKKLLLRVFFALTTKKTNLQVVLVTAEQWLSIIVFHTKVSVKFGSLAIPRVNSILALSSRISNWKSSTQGGTLGTLLFGTATFNVRQLYNRTELKWDWEDACSIRSKLNALVCGRILQYWLEAERPRETQTELCKQTSRARENP